MTNETKLTDEWECFQDAAYYDMHCVRLKIERTFGVGFHLVNAEEARSLCDLLNQRTAKTYADGLEDAAKVAVDKLKWLGDNTQADIVFDAIRALAKGDV